MGPAVVGTLLITGSAALMAVPLGVLGGIYLNEYGATSAVARVLRFLADVMTGVPSIVMGLFVYTFVVAEDPGAQRLRRLRSRSACLMLPVVIRTTEEMLRLVPGEMQREASHRARRPQGRGPSCGSCSPPPLPGIVSGALLAVARAAGETAPLLFAIGIVTSTEPSLFNGPNTTLSVQIFNNADVAVPRRAQERAWGAALTLIGIVFIFTIARSRRSRPSRAEASRMSQSTSETRYRARDREDRPRRHRPPARRRARRLGGEPVPEPPRDVVFELSRPRGALRRGSCGRGGRPRDRGATRSRRSSARRAAARPRCCGASTACTTSRPGATVNGSITYHGEDLYGAEGRPGRGAPPHRHGVPEAEPVPEVDLRQRRVRAAHQRHAARASSTTSSRTR